MQLESIKHLLLQGNVEDALERMTRLLADLDLTRNRSAPAEKLATRVAKFEAYIHNHQELIQNYGQRYRQGETISTPSVESTINQVVAGSIVKQQQWHWRRQWAHLLLLTWTKVLNNELEETFRRWHSLFRVQAKAA